MLLDSDLLAFRWPIYAGAAGGLCLTWAVSVVIYRRFFHPLAKVPGPFLMSISRLPIWRHAVVEEGKTPMKLEELHAKYGPIVRIAPNEVHLCDPDDYDIVYSGYSQGFHKDRLFYCSLDADILFNTINNDQHKRRRAIMNPFFSRQSVLKLQDIVQAKGEKLVRRVRDSIERGEPCNLDAGMRAISVDVITEYAFNKCSDHLDQPQWGRWFSELVQDSSSMWYSFVQFPMLKLAFGAVPESIARKMNANLGSYLDLMKHTEGDIKLIMANFDAGIQPSRRSIFHELLDPVAAEKDELRKPTCEHMAGEAMGLTSAAADTTGNAMSTAAYHVITDPRIYAGLTKELVEAFPDPHAEMDLLKLEKLPYLTGVIKEGLRMSYGVLGRLPRQTGETGATIKGYYLPCGTTVSMSAYLLHRNPQAFPNPDVFDPTRWIDLDADTSRLREKCLVSFCRGARICLGMNLAMAELYITLGALFRRLEDTPLKTHGVTLKDRELRDFFSAFHPKDAPPFCVVKAED